MLHLRLRDFGSPGIVALANLSLRSGSSRPTLMSAASALRSSHSHRVTTCQPEFWSSAQAFLSRSRFFRIFSFQNRAFVFGSRDRRQPRCPCQKHPWMKNTVRYFGSTMSGLPGRSARWSLKRNPSRCAAFLAAISGAVFFPRTARMFSDRPSRVRWSATALQRPPSTEANVLRSSSVMLNSAND